MKAFNAVVRIVTVAVLMGLAGFAAAQQPYPNKPIRFIVPYPPGGSGTIVAHLLGQKLSESWGQPVVVDNRPGGDTIIGTQALLNYPPDGHTILLTTPNHVLQPLLRTVPFDPIKDFAPVTPLYSSEQALLINSSVPANNLQEFIAYAKSRPGQLNYATVATGGTTHLAAEQFNIMAGLKTQQVNYKGSAQALTDLVGGQVQMSFDIPQGALPHIKTGRLKALAVSGETRLATLPQVPTFTEAGLPGFYARISFGVLVRAGTPKEIIDKLAIEIARIMAMPEIKENLLSQAMEPFISTPEQFAAMMKADMARYAGIIKTANIKLE